MSLPSCPLSKDSFCSDKIMCLASPWRLPACIEFISIALHINGRTCAGAFHGKPIEAASCFSAMQIKAGVLRHTQQALPSLSWLSFGPHDMLLSIFSLFLCCPQSKEHQTLFRSSCTRKGIQPSLLFVFPRCPFFFFLVPFSCFFFHPLLLFIKATCSIRYVTPPFEPSVIGMITNFQWQQEVSEELHSLLLSSWWQQPDWRSCTGCVFSIIISHKDCVSISFLSIYEANHKGVTKLKDKR